MSIYGSYIQTRTFRLSMALLSVYAAGFDKDIERRVVADMKTWPDERLDRFLVDLTEDMRRHYAHDTN